ncbi:DMT family transporter [Amphritea sp. HPY]|uniref:DMT family transporter n=1 Tax=Amphritea sp. HPY TaxID=3421652 RepID=UPI003D7D968A
MARFAMGLRQGQGLPVRTTGMLYSLVGALLLTPDALILRWVAIDHSEVLLWRGVFFSLGFALIVLLRHRTKALRAIVSAGWPGLVSGFFFAMNTYFYTQALQQTGAAAAMMIISTAPVFAAVIAWFWLKEQVSLTVGLTIAMTLLGMAIIVSDDTGVNSLTGNLMAIGCALFMALNFNWARRFAPRDITPGLIFGGLIILAFGWLDTDTVIARHEEIGAMFVSAAIAMPIGFVLLQIAPRYISATEVSLFLLLESIIAPVWVWIGLGEEPSEMTFLGSAVVILALLFYSYQARANSS